MGAFLPPFQTPSESSNVGLPVKPNYIHLLNGYPLDDRTKLSRVEIVPAETKTINLEYYQQNTFEPVPGLRSIDVSYYQVDLIKGKLCVLPINDCVMGTLYCDDSDTINLISNISEPDKYDGRYFFEANLPELFSGWDAFYNIALNAPLLPPAVTFTPIEILYAYQAEIDRKLRTIGANNNYWNNRDTPTADILPNSPHPMFDVDDQRAYDWHIKPQLDESFGDLVMNSPLLINIGKALDVGTWGINLDDPDLPRVDNLGWRIQRMNEVLGIRVSADGKFDPVKEKKIVRKVIPAKQKLDAEKVGVNSFGEGGMVVRRINNRFNGDKIESDQCVIVHDLLQLIQEYHEQHNLAIGLQESSAIEIKDPKDEKGKNKARFDNQLGLLLEMFNLLSSANEMTRANLISSLITQSQTNEVIAGLGLPSVTKTIPIKIDKEVTQLPYKGIAPHRSISQEIATCTYNVGIVLGQLL